VENITELTFGATAAKIRLISDDDYLPTLKWMLRNCSHRFWASVFLIDLSPDRDKRLMVNSTILEIRNAIWRGVDARLLIGGSRITFDIAMLSDAARTRALSLRIPCRWLTSHKKRGSHVKMAIADKLVLTGSHNFSSNDLLKVTQDSLLIESAALSAYLSKIFEVQWNRAGEANV